MRKKKMNESAKGSRNFYGEYSLKQWIELILRKEIILPPYQRAFVWTKEDVQDLIDSLKNGLFVPPITIGNYGNSENYILDGQQRLSAILIAYLGLFPNKEKFRFSHQEYQTTANENDDLKDDNEDTMPLEWQFTYFIQEGLGLDRDSILDKIDKDKYIELKTDVTEDDNFWRNSYIGFSLIIPISSDPAEQQTLYSSIFRNINIEGHSLSHIESRKSLYFLRENFDQWFLPKFIHKITINNAPIDFVRYLSLVSQYKKKGNSEYLAQTYKTRMEKYYESYILTEIDNGKGENSKDESMFSCLLNSENNKTRYQELENCLEREDFQKFPSIIDADVYLFGLIYYTIAENKVIDISESLFDELKKINNDFKKDSSHTKSPAAFKHLRARVRESISIYGKYLKNQTNSGNEA